MLSAGLKGIKENYELPEPSEEDVYKLDDAKLSQKNIAKLPSSLSEALKYYQDSDLVKQTLGEHIYREFYKAKLREWDEFRIAVTDWEKEKYLGVL